MRRFTLVVGLALACLLLAKPWTRILQAAAARVGTPAVGLREGSSGTTLATNSATFTTGNTIVVATSIYSPSTEEINTVTDGTNTYTALTPCEDSANNRLRMFYSVNITGFTGTVTMTPSANADYAAIVASEYSGISGFDVDVPCSSGPGDTSTTTAFTTTGPGLVYSTTVWGSGGVNTAGSGYTIRTEEWFNGRATDQDQITTGILTSNTAPMVHDNAPSHWVSAGAAFRQSSSAGCLSRSLMGIGC